MNQYKLLKFIGHLEWIPFGIKYRLISFFVPFDTNHDFETEFYSLKYKGNLSSYIDWQVYFFGAYEKKLLDLLKVKLLNINKTGTAFDIGANVGNHTLFFSIFFSQVHSFEPYEVVSRQLNDNILNNNLKNVKIHHVALSNVNGILPFSPPSTSNKGTGSLSLDRDNENEKENLLQVPVIIGDEFCEKEGIQSIDFIKLDVEGHEMEVLEGLTKTIQKFKPIILFEYSPKYDDKRKIFESILEGYTFYLIESSFNKITKNEIYKLSKEVNLLAQFKN